MEGKPVIVKADKRGVRLAAKFLRAGKAVVYPTDTAYGLGVDATDFEAVRRLYRIKGRGYKKPTHVIVKNLSTAQKLATVGPTAKKLIKLYWPGALTVVLDLRLKIKGLNLLSAGTGTIGVRVPDSKVALSLVKKLGRPITTTSANPAGGTAPYSIRDALKQFQNRPNQPDLYLDGGKLRKVRPSTIVSVKYDNIKVIRRGPVKL